MIDNLLKGASGQAVQNMNVMLGLDETTGLSDARPHRVAARSARPEVRRRAARGPLERLQTLVVHDRGDRRGEVVDARCRSSSCTAAARRSTRRSKPAGIEKRQVDGLRITDEATLDVVVSVLAGAVNTRFVAALDDSRRARPSA